MLGVRFLCVINTRLEASIPKKTLSIFAEYLRRNVKESGSAGKSVTVACLLIYSINETIGIVGCAYINSTETSVRLMSQRRAVGRRALAASVCAAAISGDGLLPLYSRP